MKKKTIYFIAQFPPPMHGLSKAVETLFNSSLQHEFDLRKIDITNNKRFLQNLWLVFKNKADLFYFTISQTKGGNLRDLLILKLLRMQHKRCLIHLHGGYYRQLVENDLHGWQRKANYKAISCLDGVIVLGNSSKRIFEGMIDDEKIFVVPNCVDDEYLMSDVEFEEKISSSANRPVKHALYLSNFIQSKGYPEVLEMARLEKERVQREGDRKLHFDFAGKFFEEEAEKFFFDYIEKYQLDDFVTYHGIVGGDKKRVLLNNSDIFVLLTRYPNEGQPISILEAMGNGMMIVTTDHAGIPDVIIDGENGILVRNGVSTLDVYHEILRSIPALVSYSTVNRMKCKKDYNQSNYIGLMEEIFHNV